MFAPEGFPLVGFAEVEGAEVAEGVAARAAPAHSAAAKAEVDNGLTGAFHGSGADLPALGQIVRVIHLVLMIAKVVRFAAIGFANGVAFAGQVECFERVQHRRTPGVLQLVTTLVQPLLPLVAAFTKQNLS